MWTRFNRRTQLFLAVIVLVTFLTYCNARTVSTTTRDVTAGLRSKTRSKQESGLRRSYGGGPPKQQSLLNEDPTALKSGTLPKFEPGEPGPPGTTYTRTLVSARLMRDNVDWMDQIPDIKKAVYIADNRFALFHPPKNKGREAMIYLTYIIDHYDDLSDITIFLHSDRFAWHDNDIFNNDLVTMINSLSNEHVIRNGYVNLRCGLIPGCRDGMKLDIISFDKDKPEQNVMAESWNDLFPEVEVPKVLKAPCCAQFALSRERIRSRPLSDYERYRDWLLHTPEPDHISGRIFEHLWHYIFTGKTELCPSLSECYCAGYGLCFGNKTAAASFFADRDRMQHLYDDLNKLSGPNRKANSRKADKIYQNLGELQAKLSTEFQMAKERGKDPEERAKEVELLDQD
jgi:hypothetical protein